MNEHTNFTSLALLVLFFTCKPRVKYHFHMAANVIHILPLTYPLPPKSQNFALFENLLLYIIS